MEWVSLKYVNYPVKYSLADIKYGLMSFYECEYFSGQRSSWRHTDSLASNTNSKVFIHITSVSEAFFGGINGKTLTAISGFNMSVCKTASYDCSQGYYILSHLYYSPSYSFAKHT